MIRLPMASVRLFLEQGLAEGTLDMLPRDRLPKKIAEGRIDEASDWNQKLSRQRPSLSFLRRRHPRSVEPTITDLQPVFRFKWGYLVLQNDEADGDTPSSISASIYGDRWCAAEIVFYLDGAPEVIREKWVEIGKVLAALVERLGDYIQRFVAEANSQEEAG